MIRLLLDAARTRWVHRHHTEETAHLAWLRAIREDHP